MDGLVLGTEDAGDAGDAGDAQVSQSMLHQRCVRPRSAVDYYARLDSAHL